jgi:ADP-ribosylglycohydrolase
MTIELSPRQKLLSKLVTDGTLRMHWAPEILEQPAASHGRSISSDRVRGMMLGLAIGDALGNTTEGDLPGKLVNQHGEIRDYIPNRYADNRQVGLPSDDTQLAFWTLTHLLDHGQVEPDALAELFCSRHIFGSGRTVRSFVREWCRSRDWKKATQISAGNGALMRIAPVVLPHLGQRGADLWVDAVLGTAITHNNPAAIASSVAFVGMLAELLTMDRPPSPGWWIEAFVKRTRPIEGDDTTYAPRGGPLKDKWRGPLWRFVEEQVPPALGLPVIEAQEIWYSGAFLLETVPCVLHILARHAADSQQAIIRAINDTKDNDTIAAIVGAAVGALHGEDALPARWRDGLLGRVLADVPDRKVFDLLDAAVRRFVVESH